MHRGLSVFGVREIERFVSYVNQVERLGSALWRRVLNTVSNLSKARAGHYEVSKEKVELIFWIHKAFLAGFLVAMSLVSVLK